MLSSQPVLQTARLVMDMHGTDDFEAFAGMWADPRITRHIAGASSSRAESWSRLLRNTGCWQMLGLGYWAVREAATGRFVGSVGFADLRRDIIPSLDRIPEIGWVLAPWSHGRGYATEAVLAATGWADANLGHPETVCLIDPDNSASLRVAEKAGYAESGRGVLGNAEPIILRRRRVL